MHKNLLLPPKSTTSQNTTSHFEEAAGEDKEMWRRGGSKGVGRGSNVAKARTAKENDGWSFRCREGF